jgi:Lamin Tail Domain
MRRILLTLTIASTMLLATATAAMAEIKIGFVYFDSPGSDTGSNASLNAEYVKIKNTGSRATVLTGWRLHDQSHHRYTFGSYTLCGGCHVKIHTGSGGDTAKNRYWGSGAYIWNNTGDKATLKNAARKVVDTCAYSGEGSWVTC